ncbi:PAS domain-containing protein [Nocardioides mangrovicus]|uniref:histidine kinase n=1 Tax=Nocardioides mangrovicus TaxID=2478913 RepID=A0A3L8P5B2_9ACTN|nr:PAS domain-containing protein [Nocardioides mangrovicus]
MVGQEALDALPDGIVVANDAGAVILTNAAAVRMLGLEGDGVGRMLRDVIRLQDRDGELWWTCYDPYAGLATKVGVPEQSWILPGGGEVLVTVRISRERGGPVQQVGLVLRSARGRERLDRERSDLVATVAHELRSPLTGVRGFVTTLISRWDVLNDEQRRLMLETVNNDAERLGRLITELLDVARIDTGRLPLYRRDVDVRALAQRVIESSRIGTNREFEFDAPEKVPTVFADPDKLTQVVTNLVENAVRHGEGTTTVSLAAAHDPHLGDVVRLIVDDEGEGIPEEIRKRVFTKFWKHGQRGGSGLGMYIVNGLVTVHGGTLEISDSPAGGARISVLLPTTDPREAT